MSLLIKRLRHSPIFLFAVAVMFVASSLPMPVSARPSLVLADGRTSISLSAEFYAGLAARSVSMGTIGEATLRGGIAGFPITGGVIDLQNARGEINHTGGLSLASSTNRIEFFSLNIESGAPIPNFSFDPNGEISITDLAAAPLVVFITGLVTVNGDFLGRVPIFEFTLTDVSFPLQFKPYNPFVSTGIGVKLSPSAAQLFNSVFGGSAFTPGLNMGQASIFAYSQAAHSRTTVSNRMIR